MRRNVLPKETIVNIDKRSPAILHFLLEITGDPYEVDIQDNDTYKI